MDTGGATATGPVVVNVGGSMYSTSVETLVAGSGFFAALFCGRLPTTRDEEGRVFVDRNGAVFGHVLEYLRTGQVFVAAEEGLVWAQVRAEAEFFLVGGLVAAMDALEEAAAEVVEKPANEVSTDGYYVLADGCDADGTQAFVFRSDGVRLLYAEGRHADALLHIRHQLSIMPEILRATPSVAATYADFYTSAIRRGSYAIEGAAVIIRTSQTEVNAFGVARGKDELFISRTSGPDAGTFRRFTLVPFPPSRVDPPADGEPSEES